MRQITEATDVVATPEVMFRIFRTPNTFVSCRPGISRFVQLTGVAWEAGAAFEARGEFGNERYRALGRVTLLKAPCNFAFTVPTGLGPLKDYQETYRMTFAGSSFTLLVNAQYNLPKGLRVGMMDRLVFHRHLQSDLRQVLENLSTLAVRHTRIMAKKRKAAAQAADAE